MPATREQQQHREQPPPRREGEPRRERRIRRPREIRPAGWRDIAIGVKNEIGDDNIGIVAAGVAFYAFLAIFPAVAALLSIYGLVVDPAVVQQQFSQLAGVLPEQGRRLIVGQLSQIAGSGSGALGWGVVLSILLGLWSANKGTKALFQGVNIAYNEKSTRGFVKENALTLLFTLGGILLVILSMALVVAVPAAVAVLPLPAPVETVMQWLRWPLLAVLAYLAFGAVYRYAPVRENLRWRWVSWGAGAATILWLLASWAFSFYVGNFGSYNQTYGSLAAVVVLLLWFFLSSFIILLGAEINAQIERRRE